MINPNSVIVDEGRVNKEEGSYKEGESKQGTAKEGGTDGCGKMEG